MWIDDLVLRACNEQIACKIWVPEHPTVVLGAANLAAMEVHEDACVASGIPVLKRAGGGGTVVLYDGCVIISMGCWVRQHFQNRGYFSLINDAVIAALQTLMGTSLPFQQRGVSDLCIGDRKFAGTSMFRSKNYLLYQASLIVSRNHELIDHCLKHPTREPDYRGARTHRDFLCGLDEYQEVINVAQVAATLEAQLVKQLQLKLDGELIAPDSTHFAHLQARAAT